MGELVQPGGKIVTAWAVEGDFDTRTLRSNLFEMEWPPRSGKRRRFPEVDRAEWLLAVDARQRILPGQRAFIDRLELQLLERSFGLLRHPAPGS